MRTDLTVVMEKYIGSKPELRLIEKEFDNLVKMVHQKHKNLTKKLETGDYSPNKKMTSRQLMSHPSIKKIEIYVEKLFGVKKCNLLMVSRDTLEGMTLINAASFIDGDFRKKGATKDVNKHTTLNITMSTGLISTCELQGDELTAVLLHEIGHNFERGILRILSMPSFMILLDAPLMLLARTPKVGSFFDNLRIANVVQNLKKFKEVVISMIPGGTRIRDLLDAVGELLTAGSIIIPSRETLARITLRGNILSLPTYFSEKYADSFAVDYGYAEPLGRALNKLSLQPNTIDHAVRELPVVSWIYDLNDIAWELLVSALTGYPTNQNRMRSSIDRLKKSAKDPELSPTLRKQLEKEIASYEEFYYDYYLDIEKNENKQRIFTYCYRWVAEKGFKGKLDIRDLVYQLSPASKK